MNNHYVPQLTLRKFGDRLCTYNVKAEQYKENVRNDRAFCEKDLYTNEIEDSLNRKIESQFGSLFSNKLGKETGKFELSRKEIQLIKKYLLVSVLRSIDSCNYAAHEQHFYDRLRQYAYWDALLCGESEQKAQEAAQSKEFNPFQEIEIPGETDFDYWMRTLNVILETDGTPQGVLEHPQKTYPAYRWSVVINNGYLAFWDSAFDHDEYVITDVGMTSENEVGWNGITVHNHKKTDYLMYLLVNETNQEAKISIANNLHLHSCFTENFMMFPISARRMIVEIDPFFKFCKRYPMPPLSYLTKLDNESLFYPNDCRYVLPQNSTRHRYHEDDKYIYEIKKLTSHETQYCNALFLDRIDTVCGFSSLDKAVGSIMLYKKLNEPPFDPRVDYTELYRIIEQRYGGTINV